ncbi:MAG: hypothetical protein ACI9VR_000346 [Cognaticolwellia sp.]|jgi:hypothetical protein
MLNKTLKSLDVLDWLLAAGLCGFTLLVFTVSWDLGHLIGEPWGWKGQLLRVGVSAALGMGGASVTAGFVMRSRLAYVALILASIVGVLSFLLMLPSVFMLYCLLRERSRQAFFSPQDLESAQPFVASATEPVPGPVLPHAIEAAPQAATPVFRRCS